MTENIRISALTLLENNPRKISRDQMSKLKESLKEDPEFLEDRPVLVNNIDGKHIVFAGNQRVRAAKALGWKEIPCKVRKNLSEKTMRSRTIKDNKSVGDWDYDILANEYEIDNLIDWGFTPEELSIDIDVIEGSEGEDDNQTLEPPKDPKTKIGDVYELNGHRIVCGDSTDPNTIETALENAKPEMVYTDPPYGISYHRSDGKLHGNAKAKRNSFNPIVNDETNKTAIDGFNYCVALGIEKMIWWGANYYSQVLPISSCWIVWDKDTGTNDFPDCELAWCSDDSPARIFKHTWNGMIKDSEMGQRRCHPTQKPIELAKWCIEKYSNGAKTILDLFLGSGSTLIAAEQLGRTCYGIELDIAYCDIIVGRWVNYMQKNDKTYSVKRNGEDIQWERVGQKQT